MFRKTKKIELGDGLVAEIKELSVKDTIKLGEELGPIIEAVSKSETNNVALLTAKADVLVDYLEPLVEFPNNEKLRDCGMDAALLLWEEFVDLNSNFFQAMAAKFQNLPSANNFTSSKKIA